EADRFGKRTTLPSGCIKNLTRSPDVNPRCSRIAFGIVAWPFLVIADSNGCFHYIPANVILASLIRCQAQDRTAAARPGGSHRIAAYKLLSSRFSSADPPTLPPRRLWPKKRR